MKQLIKDVNIDIKLDLSKFNVYADHYKNSLNKVFGRFAPDILNDNLINRLLTSALSINHLMQEPMEVYSRAINKLDNISVNFNLLTTNNPGVPIPGGLLTDNCYCMSVKGKVTDIYQTSQTTRPVRIVHHSFTNIKPINPYHHADSSLCLMTVDIPLLLAQFNEWSKEQLALPLLERKSTNWFINNFITPGLIKDFLEISFRNRVIKGDDNEGDFGSLGVHTNDYEREFLVRYGYLSAEMDRPNRRLNEVLMSTPSLFSENYLEAIPKQIPDMGNQDYWFILYCYLQWFSAPLNKDELTIDNKTDNLSYSWKKILSYARMGKAVRYVPIEQKTELVKLMDDFGVICKK